MILGHGIDIVEVARMRRAISRHDGAFITRVFSPDEIAGAASLKEPAAYYASRFAAKEAFAKALGTGFHGFGPKDVWVTGGRGAPPVLAFSKPLQSLIAAKGGGDFILSLTHEKKFAAASVIRSGKCRQPIPAP